VRLIYLSDNVLRIPDNLLPPDCNAEITFLAGDCKIEIISPISSSLDLILTKAFN